MSGISGFPLGSSRTGYQRISLFCVTRKLDAKSRAAKFQQKFCPKIERKKQKQNSATIKEEENLLHVR